MRDKKPLVNDKSSDPLQTFSSEDDFKFVHLSSAIHEQRFQSKPTTFFKDALHRFVKNKSSVVAAVFLGIIITMAVLVPILDQYDASEDYILSSAAFLPPKWYGCEKTGFMDGTQMKYNVVIDPATNEPAATDTDNNGYDPQYIVGSINFHTESINVSSSYASGGDVRLVPNGTDFDFGGIYSSSFDLHSSYQYSLAIDLDKNMCASANAASPSYAVYILADLDGNSSDYEAVIPLLDYTSDYSNFSLSDFMAVIKESAAYKANPLAVFSAEINIRVKNPMENPYPNFYVKNVKATCSSNPTFFDKINFSSGNELLLRDDSTSSTYPYRWRINGDCYKFVYAAQQIQGDFRYDLYESAFGNVTREFSKTDLQKYIDQGLCTYDFTKSDSEAPATFTVLSEHCPIVSITSQNTVSYGGVSAVTLTGVLSKLRYYGFTTMPHFLFGTDKQGRDYFKYLFTGLRTSLLLGVFAAAINIAIGLIWGSISGYFGGWTDIVMERFTEILGGVPWIVVMTLVILHLGSTFWTFLLALSLTGWIGVASETRSQFYRYKGREYVLASRTLGANDWRLIFKHILPNGVGPIITGAVLMIPSVIFDEATISYLGLGLQGLQSFGVALTNAETYIADYPYMIISGSVIMSILMISFNLFGNGLRDAANPSLKGVSE
jgi:ABC-type dipeptide/oligopeptide/nickel transport system permease subunit